MAKRWVIKLGSGLLTRQDGKVDRVQIGRIADQVAGRLRSAGSGTAVNVTATASGRPMATIAPNAARTAASPGRPIAGRIAGKARANSVPTTVRASRKAVTRLRPA